MDKEHFEALIKDKLPDIRMRGILLYNGVAQSLKSYREDPTQTRLKDWQASEEALNKFIRGIDGQVEERPIGTIAAVLEYLKTEGWKTTKTSLYRHQSEGKFRPQKDGTYREKDIDKYAKTWLKQQSTGKKVSEQLDELQRKIRVQELQNQELEYERKKFLHERDLGKFIPREQLELELAARAGVLDAGLKHWIQSRAADWIRAANGDTKKVGDMINMMSGDLDEYINSYASTKEYQVIIDGKEEAEIEEQETEC